MQAKAGVSVAQAQYDLMLAGYRDEEISRAAAAVKQAKAAYDYAQNFITVSKAYGKAVLFPPTTGKCALIPRPGTGDAEICRDKLSQYRTGNRAQDIAGRRPALSRRRRS